MPSTTFEWTMVCLAAGAAYALIRFFLNRTLSHTEKKTDDNTRELQALRADTVAKEDFDKAAQKLSNDVEEIKQTYVTRREHKDDLHSIKNELQNETRKLTRDVEEIKANYLTRSDFIHTQAKTDKQLDKIYDVLLQLVQKGDRANGRE